MAAAPVVNPFGSHRILVVDDEEPLREILSEALTQLGHTVTTAADGREALTRLERSPVDVVITDLHMPEMDGMTLLGELKNRFSNLAVIAVTGFHDKYRYSEVIAAGAADFITKPFTLDELEAKLIRLFRERSLQLQLEEMARRDALTGLYNRRHFETVMADEAVRSSRYRHPLSLLFLDVDRFKQYNDRYGHRAGDALLKELAGVLNQSIRTHVDKAFRYGGDEFVVVLPMLDEAGACKVADRIRENYARACSPETSLSIGVAAFQPTSGDRDRDIEELVRRADARLYYGKKRLGGGRTCCADDLSAAGDA